MRIIAGTARGRVLVGPKKADTIRPTADRVRETLFNILGQWMTDFRVLDLFAGTGALALEALSRGAAQAVLVDSGREAVELCRANAQALGFEAQVQILSMPAARGAEQLGRAGLPFDLIFADPPYAARAVAPVLEWVTGFGLLAPGGTLCIEHDKREDAAEGHGGMTRVDQRRFGDTVISLFRFA